MTSAHFSYGLSAVAQRHGFPVKREGILRLYAAAWGVDPKGGMWRLPAEAVGPYGEYDAQLPLQLLEHQLPLIEDEGMTAVYDQECALLPALERIRQRGVRVDLDQLDRVERDLVREVADSLAEIKHHTGTALGVEDLTLAEPQVALIRSIGLTPSITEKQGKESVTNEILDASDHPAAAALARARRAQKLIGTFVTSTRHFLVRGRIHSTYKQSRTTGRVRGRGRGAARTHVVGPTEHPTSARAR